MQTELTEEETGVLNYAVKHGYLDDATAEEMLENPLMARKYIAECDAQG